MTDDQAEKGERMRKRSKKKVFPVNLKEENQFKNKIISFSFIFILSLSHINRKC